MWPWPRIIHGLHTCNQSPKSLRLTSQTEKLFIDDEKRELIDFLAHKPLAGDEIPSTGGVRKVLFAASGRGKRGRARIIYYYLNGSMPLYALLANAKNDMEDMTPEQKRIVSTLAAALKVEWKESKSQK